MTLNFDRNEKNFVRSCMIQALPPLTSVLTLPGPDALCARELLSTGKITRHTRQQWVESNKRIIPALHHIRDELQLENCSIHHRDLEDFEPIYPVDFANVDLMTGITTRVGFWMQNTLSRNLLDGAWVAVTNIDPHTSRRNPFGQSWFPDFWTKNELIKKKIFEMFYAGKPDDLKVSEVEFLIRAALHEHPMDTVESWSYKDTHYEMMTHLFQLSGNRFEVPSFRDIAEQFNYDEKTFNRTMPEILPASLRAYIKTVFNQDLVREDEDSWSICIDAFDRSIEPLFTGTLVEVAKRVKYSGQPPQSVPST